MAAYLVLPARRSTRKAFTLVEVLIASGLLAVMLTGAISLMMANRIAKQKAADTAIMLDFTQHFIEMARAQPFASIQPGLPLNTLYDGTHSIVDSTGQTSTILMKFPTGNAWQKLTDANYQNFHPDLVWLEGRSPQMQCIITTQGAATEPRAKRIQLNLRWNPPMSSANKWMTLSAETLVYPDFN